MTKARVEVVTSVERRRHWTTMEKQQLVAATLEPGASASAVARQAGMHPSQLDGWRRQLRARGPAGFAPVRVRALREPAWLDQERSRSSLPLGRGFGSRVRSTWRRRLQRSKHWPIGGGDDPDRFGGAGVDYDGRAMRRVDARALGPKLQRPLPIMLCAARQRKIKPRRRHESTLGRTHKTKNAGLRREANHAAVRRVVGSVDDPVRRHPQPEWNRHLPTTIDQHLVAVSVLPELHCSAIRKRAAPVPGCFRLSNHGASAGSGLSGGAATAA
jgi:transposase